MNREATGQPYFTLAFITSGGGCTPAWGGVIPVTDDFYHEEINALRGSGGDVILSFGGASGIELAMACTSVDDLADGLSVLQNALSNEVRIDTVSIMAMDYGSAAAPDPEGMMGEYAIEAAGNLFGQLEVLFPEKPDDEIWGMIGITPMIGRNDVPEEIFLQQDAEQLLAFAQFRDIDLLSMWSIARDRECEGGGSMILFMCHIPR